MVEKEKIRDLSPLAFVEELVKAAMVVSEVCKNDYVPENIRKEKKLYLKLLKDEALRRLEETKSELSQGP